MCNKHTGTHRLLGTLIPHSSAALLGYKPCA